MKPLTRSALFLFCILWIAGCDGEKSPSIDVERNGRWNVAGCDRAEKANDHWCHALFCEATHRNEKLVPRNGELVEMAQNYGYSDGKSVQTATYRIEGSIVRATCDMQQAKVLAATVIDALP